MSKLSDIELLDRIKGMLIGLFLGDALGAPHEFRNSKLEYTGKLEHITVWKTQYQGEKRLSPGQITDDSEMTITLARQLIKDKGYVRDNVILKYLEWCNSDNLWMLGINTRAIFKGIKTMKGYTNRIKKVLELPEEKRTQSNGALMRCCTLALFSNCSELAQKDCSITNPNSICIQTEIMYVFFLRRLLLGDDFKLSDLIDTFPLYISKNEEIGKLFSQLKNDERDVGKNKGWVLHSFYCAMLVLDREYTFTKAMGEIIKRRGDTDTNAGIAGALLGAKYGYKKLYEEQKENIDIILNLDSTKNITPRHQQYSPFDFHSLSEELFNLLVV
jgi:ADP-ribosyl-[dinitrogen reductase] hydrolase